MIIAGQHSRLPLESESGGHLHGGERSGTTDPFQASHDDIRLALHKVLSSSEFSSVFQLRSFLNYVVSKAIADRPDEVKGYTIAVEALGRDVSFNPVTDPIVRVEAARLRRRLAKYYSGSGKSDPIVIEIPKGSYVPVFTLRENDNGEGAMQPSRDASRSQQERPGKDANPAEISPTAEPVPRDMDGPFDKSLPETAHSGAVRRDDLPAASADADTEHETSRRGLPLPVAIAILLLTFFAGYAFGAIL